MERTHRHPNPGQKGVRRGPHPTTEPLQDHNAAGLSDLDHPKRLRELFIPSPNSLPLAYIPRLTHQQA